MAPKAIPANSETWKRNRQRGETSYQVPYVTDTAAFYRNCHTLIDEDGGRVAPTRALGLCPVCAGARYVATKRTKKVVPCPRRCWL